MKTEAQYYTKNNGKSPIVKMMGSLSFVDKKNVESKIDKLEDGRFESLFKSNDVDSIKGEKNLYELRPTNYRIFFSIKKFPGKIIYRLLCMFKKQGDKKGYNRHIKLAKNNDNDKEWD